jgi:K+-transporting ATPase A subunit
MNADALQAVAFVMIVALVVTPVGAYLERVFERRQTFLDPLLLVGALNYARHAVINRQGRLARPEVFDESHAGEGREVQVRHQER